MTKGTYRNASGVSDFIEALEPCILAWHTMKYGSENSLPKSKVRLSLKEMRLFLDSVHDWGHMFFCSDDLRAQDLSWTPRFVREIKGKGGSNEKKTK